MHTLYNSILSCVSLGCSCSLREACKVKLLCSSTSSIPFIPKFFSMFLPFISPLFASPCLAVVSELNRQLLLSYCLFMRRIKITVDGLVSFCQPVMQRAMVGNVFLAPTVLNEALIIIMCMCFTCRCYISQAHDLGFYQHRI